MTTQKINYFFPIQLTTWPWRDLDGAFFNNKKLLIYFTNQEQPTGGCFGPPPNFPCLSPLSFLITFRLIFFFSSWEEFLFENLNPDEDDDGNVIDSWQACLACLPWILLVPETEKESIKVSIQPFLCSLRERDEWWDPNPDLHAIPSNQLDDYMGT